MAISFQLLNILSSFYLIKYDRLIDAIRHSYALRHDYSNVFLMTTESIIFYFVVGLRFPRHLSTIKVLQNRYGDVIVRKVRDFENLDFIYRKLLLDFDFLNACLKKKTIPTFLRWNCHSLIMFLVEAKAYLW